MVIAPSVAVGKVQLTGTLLALPTPRLVTRLALMKSMRRFREIVRYRKNKRPSGSYIAKIVEYRQI